MPLNTGDLDKVDKYISYNYLYSKRDHFPFTYRMVFEKLIDEAPARYYDDSNNDEQSYIADDRACIKN